MSGSHELAQTEVSLPVEGAAALRPPLHTPQLTWGKHFYAHYKQSSHRRSTPPVLPIRHAHAPRLAVRRLPGGPPHSSKALFQPWVNCLRRAPAVDRTLVGLGLTAQAPAQLMAEERHLEVDVAGYQQAMREQRERSRAAGKATGGPTLKFEAEATAHLQSTGVPLTDDQPKCVPAAHGAGFNDRERAQAYRSGVAARSLGSRGMRRTAVPTCACRRGC